MAGYVELHAHSAYSFLDGASQPEELAARAAELGYEALALTDHDGVYGSLEFAHAAKAFGVRAITGAEVTLEGGAHITLLVETRRGYANLCRLLTTAHAGTRRVGREDREPLPPSVPLETVAESNEGLICLSGCARRGLGLLDPNAAVRLAGAFGGPDRFFVELQRPFERGDTRRLTLLRDLAEHLGVETVATGDVHSHHPRRTLLQDVLVAIRCRTSLEGCEPERRGNRESYLRSPEEMLERFSFDRAAAERSSLLGERLEFDLTEELGYSYPDFSDGEEPAISRLAAICHEVDQPYHTLSRLELGLEDEGVAAVLPADRAELAGGLDRPVAVLGVAEERREDGAGVEPRHAEPIDRPVPADQRGRLAVADQGVVLNAGRHARPLRLRAAGNDGCRDLRATTVPPPDGGTHPLSRAGSVIYVNGIAGSLDSRSPGRPCPRPGAARGLL